MADLADISPKPPYEVPPEKLGAWQGITIAIRGLTSLDREMLAQTTEPDHANFKQILPDIDRIRQLASITAPLRYGVLPLPEMHTLQTAFDEALAALNKLRNFKVANHDNWQVRRKEIIDEITTLSDRFAKTVLAPLTLLAAIELGPGRSEDRIAPLVDQAEKNRQLVQNAEFRASAILAQMEQMAKASAELTQAKSISHHAGVFEQEASNYHTAAKRWMAAIGLLSLVTLLAALYNVEYMVERSASFTGAQVAQASIGKILFFSVLGGAIVFASAAYRAARHNAVVNKHRANALATFDAFVASAVDPEVRNTILIQTTSSIFSPQPSGYMSGDQEMSGASQIIELNRSLIPTAQK